MLDFNGLRDFKIYDTLSFVLINVMWNKFSKCETIHC